MGGDSGQRYMWECSGFDICGKEFELCPEHHTEELLQVYGKCRHVLTLSFEKSLAACGQGRGVSEKQGRDDVTDLTTSGIWGIREGPQSPTEVM